MADIELVIKISEEWFDDMVREEFTEVDELCAVIQHGTTLPKGHGRLIDEKEVKKMIEEAKVNSEHSKTFAENIIEFAPTIVEADKGE